MRFNPRKLEACWSLLPGTWRNLPLLQLRILGPGFFQDGDVGVGIFPECQEVLVAAFTVFAHNAVTIKGFFDLQRFRMLRGLQ